MKLPKTFVPDPERSKNKIYELSKNCWKTIPKLEDIDEDMTLDDKIVIQAKGIARKLGKIKGESYVFTDKKSSLVISYNPSVALQDIQLLVIQHKKGSSETEDLFRSVKWNEYSKEEIRIYTPGNWHIDLDRLYKKAQKK
ncbi:hypothetical protein FJZ53_06380 [Candidatus Woesearchaeota archaeon]|nr:hypothetical protein [Candidatus Woesearchaeota archaeon]